MTGGGEESGVTYDEVAYPSLSHSIVHPDVMAVLARLYDLEAADLTACRVLELGCGTGRT